MTCDHCGQPACVAHDRRQLCLPCARKTDPKLIADLRHPVAVPMDDGYARGCVFGLGVGFVAGLTTMALLLRAFHP